jgi:hypothetical protein
MSTINMDQERAALLQIHAQSRRAHFERDVDLLLANGADEFISVSNGRIDRPSREGQKAFFTEYFKGATYYEWDDMEPPIIRISEDATLAWMIVRTNVRRTTRIEESGEERETRFVYAGIMTYEKQDGVWRRVANVSTFAQ